MKDKILDALRAAGHALSTRALFLSLPTFTGGDIPYDDCTVTPEFTRDALPALLIEMENEKLIICHRSTGSAGVPKGQITLICLRPTDY